jgi:putative flippase GtrA
MNRPLFRFALVGCANTLADYSIFCLLVAAGIDPQLANAAGIALAATISFAANRRFTFRSSRERTTLVQQISRHAAVAVGATCASSLIIQMAMPWVGAMGAKAMAIPAAFFWSYGLSSRWVWPLGREAGRLGTQSGDSSA